MIYVWTDGSITGSHWAKKAERGTLPHAWSGWVAKTTDGHRIHHLSLDLGEHPRHSANIAEYMAVRSALYWLSENHRAHTIKINSDSQLVMCQLSGAYQCHDERLRALRDHVRALATRFPKVIYNWIPREQNREADVLSKGFQVWGRTPMWEEVEEAVSRSR